MARRRGFASFASVLISAALLLWPAVWNGYPLVFGASGVYLRDGVQFHMSWPRPLFYGLFMLPLHLKITAWPVVVAQALITSVVLQTVIRAFLPGLGAFVLVLVTLVLAVCTSLPWFVSQLMPDVFGGLMLLVLALLILAPERLGAALGLLAVLFAAGCVTMHQGFLPVACVAVLVLLICRTRTGEPVRWSDLLRGAAVPVLALGAMIGANTVLLGETSPSPYGKLFILSRILVDGPGKRALDRECPRPDWVLCGFKDNLPTTPETIQFGEEGLLARAGGHRVVAREAWPIILSAVSAEPASVLRDAARNTVAQLLSFRTADWLVLPMEDVVAAWRAIFPPAEQARYQAGRQFQLRPLIPDALQALHLGVGSVAQLVLLFGTVAALRRRQALGGLYAAITAALLVNAVVSGALSGVHDRYQSRFVWLATFAALLILLAWWRRLHRDQIGAGP